MVIPGRVQKGVVVLENGTSLPDGTEVTVSVCAEADRATAKSTERMPEEERRRIRAIMDRIAALPDENPDDTFSGADHDKVLYGKP